MLLIVVWLFGGTVVPAAGDLVHILIVIALVLFIVRLVQGKKVL